MKLTNDLIRDTLLCIEEKCESYTDASNRFNYKSRIHWKYIYEDEKLNCLYDIDDIKYCILKLKEANFVDAFLPGRPDKISSVNINGLTYEGHMFLNSIKDDDLWNSIKSKIGDVAKVPISVVSKVVVEVGSLYLK